MDASRTAVKLSNEQVPVQPAMHAQEVCIARHKNQDRRPQVARDTLDRNNPLHPNPATEVGIYRWGQIQERNRCKDS